MIILYKVRIRTAENGHTYRFRSTSFIAINGTSPEAFHRLGRRTASQETS